MKLSKLAKLFLLCAVVGLASGSSVIAAVQTRDVSYRQGETELQGFLAWDDSGTARRPGVLVVHEWWGHNAHARNQAVKLAEAGYVALALDMYGKGKVTTHPADAQAFVAEATKDRGILAARFNAALDLLKADAHVDPERVAAIGYCFGGAVALGMARRGADLDAVVSFHGSLGTDEPAAKGAVKARILVLNGADDPMITAEHIATFHREMSDAGASYRFVNIPRAKHSFTNPDADEAGVPGLAYDAKAARRAWKEMLKLFREIWR